jgi:predicted PurR-regulated permease PerM
MLNEAWMLTSEVAECFSLYPERLQAVPVSLKFVPLLANDVLSQQVAAVTTWAFTSAVCAREVPLRIAAHLGGRSGLAATLLVVLGIAVFVVPIALLMSSLGDSIRTLIEAVQQKLKWNAAAMASQPVRIRFRRSLVHSLISE